MEYFTGPGDIQQLDPVKNEDADMACPRGAQVPGVCLNLWGIGLKRHGSQYSIPASMDIGAFPVPGCPETI